MKSKFIGTFSYIKKYQCKILYWKEKEIWREENKTRKNFYKRI